ncbi:MAG: acyl-CoA thioesterase [Planctomycetes bacterium RBG_16_59_8]|nr:MAG: acyl-CoA thioesterase [Planctomycetes bacterium RBG_16_59_8]
MNVSREKPPRRSVRMSQVEMTQLVLPNDTNQLGNLLGGRLMEWMDIAAAISAQRHGNRVCVTAAVDELVFHQPIRLGEVVTLRAFVNRVFGSSMEVGVQVLSENQLTGERKTANTAYLTFVAVDEKNNPVKVSPIIPRTREEKRRYRDALSRRVVRLKRRRKG